MFHSISCGKYLMENIGREIDDWHYIVEDISRKIFDGRYFGRITVCNGDYWEGNT